MALYPNHFYHSHLRNYVIAFGNLFKDIQIVRLNKLGQEDHRERVPLTYARKEKFITRLDQDPEILKNVAIQLPRMSFTLQSILYNPERMLQPLQPIQKVGNGTTDFSFNPVRYDLIFELGIYANKQDESNQIIEQILPFFTPDYTVNVKVMPELNHSIDVPIVLQNVDLQDSYDGQFEERRAIFCFLTFSMKASMYGPIRTKKHINTVVTDVYPQDQVGTGTRTTTVGDEFGYETSVTDL